MDPSSLNKKKAMTINTNSKSFGKDDQFEKPGKTVSKDSKNQFTKKKKYRGVKRGVIYLGSIPHGFYEDEMRSYFSQFGKVRATTVARSRKTGRSKGYGFVEFDNEEVAQIAAEAMNNYFMFNRVLKCRYIPPEERRSRIFPKTYIAGEFPRKTNRIIDSNNKKNAFLRCNQQTYCQKTAKKIQQFKKFFEERNIDFNFKFSPENSQVSDSHCESTDGVNDQYGVLEIDESEHEISFKTPPNVKKVIKKTPISSSESLMNVDNDATPTVKKIKSNTLKNSDVKSTENLKKLKKIKKSTSDLQGIKQKDKSQKKILKGKEKLLEKSTEAKKLRPSKKTNSTALKQKRAKILNGDDLALVKTKNKAKQKSNMSENKINKNKTQIELVM